MKNVIITISLAFVSCVSSVATAATQTVSVINRVGNQEHSRVLSNDNVLTESQCTYAAVGAQQASSCVVRKTNLSKAQAAAMYDQLMRSAATSVVSSGVSEQSSVSKSVALSQVAHTSASRAAESHAAYGQSMGYSTSTSASKSTKGKGLTFTQSLEGIRSFPSTDATYVD